MGGIEIPGQGSEKSLGERLGDVKDSLAEGAREKCMGNPTLASGAAVLARENNDLDYLKEYLDSIEGKENEVPEFGLDELDATFAELYALKLETVYKKFGESHQDKGETWQLDSDEYFAIMNHVDSNVATSPEWKDVQATYERLNNSFPYLRQKHIERYKQVGYSGNGAMPPYVSGIDLEELQ